ncbi:MAG: hypothetical protein K8T20_04520 [Planctomycetes bacterium]|nr:hypothetical protein [Planctomycetota bacterium]
MSAINKKSILLNYRGPLQAAATNQNSVVIAGGIASTPTGRPFTIESSQRAAPHYDGVGVDSTRTPETMWPTGPGIQIVRDERDSDPNGECTCECCCLEPEPALLLPRAGCGDICPADVKTISFGVFLQGTGNIPGEERERGEIEVMRQLCRSYPGESYYTVVLDEPISTKVITEKMFDRIVKLVCDHCIFDFSKNEVVECPKIEVDVFGFSRGGAAAIRIAQLLNEGFECEACGVPKVFRPFRIRFLGVLDPVGGDGLPGAGLCIPPVLTWCDLNRIPSNVDHFYIADSNHFMDEGPLDAVLGRRKMPVTRMHMPEGQPPVDSYPVLTHAQLGKSSNVAERIRKAYQDATGIDYSGTTKHATCTGEAYWEKK